MASKPMIVKGVIHGRTIVLDCDPGFDDGCEVVVSLIPPAQPPSDATSDTDSLAACKRWPEDCEGIQCIQPVEDPHPAVDGWTEFTD